MKKLIILATTLVLIAFFAVSLISCEKPKEKTAIQVAENWLVLIDGEKYLESWEGLSNLYKANDTKEKWVDHYNRYRKPLGKLIGRKLINKNVTSYSEAPEGEYIIFQYEAPFENKKLAAEAVSIVKDQDGKWRILGYFIDVT